MPTRNYKTLLSNQNERNHREHRSKKGRKYHRGNKFTLWKARKLRAMEDLIHIKLSTALDAETYAK